MAFTTEAGGSDKASEDFCLATTELLMAFDGLSSPPGLTTGCRYGTPW